MLHSIYFRSLVDLELCKSATRKYISPECLMWGLNICASYKKALQMPCESCSSETALTHLLVSRSTKDLI